MHTRKPNGYWSDLVNVKQELETIIQQTGHFPTAQELKDLGKTGLLTGILTYQHGLNTVREKMGYGVNARSPGYWEGWDNLENELKPVIEKIGHFPSLSELRRIGRLDLEVGIQQHGGHHALRDRLGYKQVRNKNGYWQRWENIEREMQEITAILGHFPKVRDLTGSKRSTLSAAISKYHHGLRAVKERMGYARTISPRSKSPSPERTESPKPQGYWDKWDNVENTLRGAIEQLGHFPSYDEMKSMGISGVRTSAMRHGGMRTIRERLGSILVRREDGYWQNWDNYETELRAAITKIGHFPTQKELLASGLSSIASAAHHHGGFIAVKERLGYKASKKPHRYWNEWDNIERELKQATEALGHFPSQKELKQLGLSRLNMGAQKFGGLLAIKERFGYQHDRKPEDFWKSWDNFKTELDAIIAQLRHFPSKKELDELHASGIESAAALYHGGMREVRRRIGVDLKIRESGYWTPEVMKRSMKEIIQDIGHYPTRDDLRQKGLYALGVAVSKKYPGGSAALRKELGYEIIAISNKREMIAFLNEDEAARNLAIAAATYPPIQNEIEAILADVHEGRFKSTKDLHDLLTESSSEIYALLDDGMTSLGTYIGGYSREDCSIVPVLLGQAIEHIPEDRITDALEQRLVRILRVSYSPMFNENSSQLISFLDDKIKTSKEKVASLYKNLRQHYQEILSLKEELA